MKIKIKVEDNKKCLEIPLKIEEIRELYDELWRTVIYYDENYKKISKDRRRTYKILASLQMKLMHLVHDIIDRGVVYKLENDKFIKEKIPSYHKKPKWKKII